MEDRDIEIEKCREMLKWFIQDSKNKNSPSNPNTPATITRPGSLNIPEESFIKRWRRSDKLFDGKYSSSGASTPQTPATPIHDIENRLRSHNTPLGAKSGGNKYYFGKENQASDWEDDYNVSRYYEDFTELNTIGSGSFGTVFQCRHRLDGLLYAVKKVPMTRKNKAARDKALQEALTLAASSSFDDNTYIIRYHSVWIEKDNLFVSMELCDCSLSSYIERVGKITEQELRKIMRDLCKGLKKLHARNIVHLDIKAENILYSFTHKFKLADLGLARITTNISGEVPEGDNRYLAQELLNIMPNDPESIPDLTKADIFSLGATMLEIMRDEELPGNGKEWHDIRDGNFNIPGGFSAEIKKTVKKMMSKNPADRPTAEELLNEVLVSKTKQDLKKYKSYSKYLERTLEIFDCPYKKRKLSI
ncbi:unnamed protein product [Blepharisma stoltei]|uniref:Protein kinase domain-containing protein n=1 Tax=Blepharisma stoltei TaxID=1481888 RepID=A0AAU9I6S4_9CILI|nr:unnamed protein product [Blepharisma stoltei]